MYYEEDEDCDQYWARIAREELYSTMNEYDIAEYEYGNMFDDDGNYNRDHYDSRYDY
jgi:hypothetical protein